MVNIKKKVLGTLLLSLAVTPLLASDIACKTPTQAFSNLDKMSKGDFSSNVKWAQVKLSSTSVGYGPAANRENETTIVDGTVYLAHPDAKGKEVVEITAHPDKSKGSAMLMVSSPKAWVAMPDAMDAISSFDDLSFVMDDIADDIECDDDALLAFKIVGHANSLTMSLDTEPKHLVKDYSDKNVTIVGLYTRSDKAKYFMVKGYNIHPHVIMTDDKIAGHLRTVDLQEGATLYLPKK